MEALWVAILVVLALLALCTCARAPADSSKEGVSSPAMPLGQRLNNQGWMLFGNKTCPFCTRQLKELGADLQLVRYIDADAQKSLTIAAGVERYPSWYNTKTKELRVGFKTRYQLYQMSQPMYNETLNLQTAPDGTVRLPQSIPMPEIYLPQHPQSRDSNPWAQWS